jgi:hypothetical protein
MSSNEVDGGVRALARLIASDPVIGPELTTWITEGVARRILAAGYLSPEQAAARERQAGAAVLREAAAEVEALESFAHGKNTTSNTFLLGHGTAQRVIARRLRDRAERLEAGDD